MHEAIWVGWELINYSHGWFSTETAYAPNWMGPSSLKGGPSSQQIFLFMRPANERWRYSVTPSRIGWAHTQDVPDRGTLGPQIWGITVIWQSSLGIWVCANEVVSRSHLNVLLNGWVCKTFAKNTAPVLIYHSDDLASHSHEVTVGLINTRKQNGSYFMRMS